MGCGTGSFGANDTFVITLRFNKSISEGDAVYTHFKDAVELLLDGQIKMAPSTMVNGLVREVKVTVKGPLSDLNVPRFNRAFNRLMWGVQRRRPGDVDSAYEVTVLDRQLNEVKKNDDPWMTEFT